MTEDDPVTKLQEALEIVRQRFDIGADDWRHSLLNTFLQFSRAIGIERPLLDPLHRLLIETDDDILRDRTGPSAQMFHGRRMALSLAAACVTTLKDRKDCPSIGEAVKAVAGATGIDEREITNFRNGLNRGSYGEDAQKGYEAHLREVEQWPMPDMLKAVGGLSRYL